MFKGTTFRPGQATLIDALLSGRDTMEIMPTGLGSFVMALKPGDRLYLPGVRALLEGDGDTIRATILQSEPNGPTAKLVKLSLPGLTQEERDIILAGCLINYYK